jgi:periplasmic divalent cation tolerance protein
MKDYPANRETKLGIILVTAGSEAEAADLASHLVNGRLAACVSITPIRSVYTWKGKVENDPEWQLVIKTNLNRFDEISQAIMARHSYEVPEIIAIPIQQGLPSYLNWMAEQTTT